MKRFSLLLASLLMVIMASAQDVVVTDDITTYTGDATFVYSKADGKTYTLNNLGKYELYGVYVKTNTLNIADPDAKPKVIDYIATDNEHKTYINTGYVHAANTRIVADVEFTEQGGGWEAVFGARQGGFGEHAFVLFATADHNGNHNGVFNRSGAENDFNNDIPTGVRLIIDASGLTATVSNQATSETIATATSTGNADDGTNAMFIFDTNTAGAGELKADNSRTKMKLYGFQIYEGNELLRDYKPVVNTEGKGGLYDEITKTYLYSADDKVDFLLSPDAESNLTPGIPVYTGKMVLNTNDNHIYKYNGTGWTDLGTRTLAEIASTDYKNMKNWNCPNDHWQSVFGEGNNINWNEPEQENTFDPYVGTGGWEPLRYVFKNLEVNADYKVTFNYSTGGWKTWDNNGNGGNEVDSPVNMPFKIIDREDFNTNNGHFGTDAGWINGAKLTPDAQDKTPVAVDFSTPTSIAQFIIQFGVVNDNTSYWFKFDNLSVKKYNYPEAYPVLNIFGPQIEKLLPEVADAKLNTTEAIKTALDKAIVDAEVSLQSSDLAVQQAALENLQKTFALAKDVDVTILQKTIEVSKPEGISTADAEDFIQNGTEKAALDKTLNALRVARKVAHMEKDNADYAGNEPVDGGNFYLYNVGRKAYLTNGSDHGTHAALGFPGLEATLAAAESSEGYTIQFNELIPAQRDGGGNVTSEEARDKFLGGSPYVDCWDNGKGTYTFVPVSGKTNVFTIKGDRGYLAFDPEGEVDGGGIKHFNTVTAMWSEPKNEDAEWILVSKADREAQLDKATSENPVDASFVIKNASFNKYANNGSPWSGINQSWGWGDRNFGDKNTEHFHGETEETLFSLSQEISLPKEGWYELTVQAYFRDGNINPHVESVVNEETLAEAPVLYFNMEETQLMYIDAEADKAPGEGTDTKIGNFPNNMNEASKFFENGLYKNSLLFHVDAADISSAVIGIDEQAGYRADSWIVIDNFRLKYYGNGEEPVITGVESVKTVGETNAPRVIYNLNGQKVQKAQKGLYIVNGKKVVIK